MLTDFLKDTVKPFVPPGVRREIRRRFFDYSERFEHFTREKWVRSIRSYSQFGEDAVASAFFAKRSKTPGFYVDIGAHSPAFMSNTYHFYKQGWRGINIEPTPGRIKMFERARPRDINLALAISEREEELTFFVFGSEGLMNTADPEQAKACAAELRETPQQVKVRARPLRDVLADNLPASLKIDLMSVDVEGMDAAVLRSNDWTKYRPDLLLVECLVPSMEDVWKTETFSILAQAGYHMHAWVPKTAFFVPNDHQAN